MSLILDSVERLCYGEPILESSNWKPILEPSQKMFPVIQWNEAFPSSVTISSRFLIKYPAFYFSCEVYTCIMHRSHTASVKLDPNYHLTWMSAHVPSSLSKLVNSWSKLLSARLSSCDTQRRINFAYRKAPLSNSIHAHIFTRYCSFAFTLWSLMYSARHTSSNPNAVPLISLCGGHFSKSRKNL
jgi:hypothetical protein